MEQKRIARERNYALDFLKVLGCITIYFHHYQQVTAVKFDEINFCFGRFNFGYVVELFFILSGYFMYTYEEKIRNGVDFKSFFSRRACRLLPVVAIVAFAFTYINSLYHRAFDMDWYDKPLTLWSTLRAALGISEGWGLPDSFVNYPTWYISVLLLCYCIFYGIVYFAKKLQVPTEYIYVLMIIIGMGGFTYGTNQTFLKYTTSRGYYSFFYGILLKKFLDEKGISKKLIRISLAIAIIFPLMIVWNTEYVTDGINYIVTFFFYPAIIILLHTDIAKKMFRSKIFGILGEISFDVYIWHLPLIIAFLSLNYLEGWNVNYMNRSAMIIGLVICFIAGTLSHYLIEKPINRYIQSKFLKA